MNVFVIRNSQQYGPYDEQTLLSYVNSGQILLSRDDKRTVSIAEEAEIMP